MKGQYLNKLLGINVVHALYRADGKWYHNLKRFPGVLFDDEGYIVFPTEASYINHPKLQRKSDLHVTDGISGLDGYMRFTQEQRLLIGDTTESVELQPREETIRIKREIELRLRKKSLVDRIKKLYNNTCQLCETRLEIGKGQYYSEVHHIKPLGRPHNGPDVLENMICVCPNCHALLDLGGIALGNKSFKIQKHSIRKDYLRYHNKIYTLIESPDKV